MWTDALAIATYIALAGGILSGCHALLNKRDPRSQLGWLLLCVFVPFFGVFFYWLLGVNRIQTRARQWQAAGRFGADSLVSIQPGSPVRAEQMRALVRMGGAVTKRPLLDGNVVRVLHNGEQAYPEMLDAIAAAQKTINLCTYIFETDEVGHQFVDALVDAGKRGVKVRFLVDAVGERYGWKTRVTKLLRHADNVECARFLPLVLSLRALRINLRNHRKILVCDGRVGFTGGMNIGRRHMALDPDNRKQTIDMHFRIDGPAVQFLEEAFAQDWWFASGGDRTFGEYRAMPPAGSALCRGITDGPNEDLERLQWVLIGALAAARDRVRIMTPYFIPNRELLASLTAAALRGVTVEVILPRKNNIPIVAWATNSMAWELLRHGVRIYYRPPPFAHSKLFLVDDYYVNIGSANLDPRSLRLNFEFNLEVFDSKLGAELGAHFDDVLSRSHELTIEEADARSLPIKFRDALAKVFSPYL